MGTPARFEWDLDKALKNQQKHKVSFEVAGAVLADHQGDQYHLARVDDDHSQDEARWVTIASVPTRRTTVLTIVWTMRGGITRIISARRASRKERNDYGEAIRQKEKG